MKKTVNFEQLINEIENLGTKINSTDTGTDYTDKGVDCVFIDHHDGTGTKMFKKLDRCIMAWAMQLYLGHLNKNRTTKVLSNIYITFNPALANNDNSRFNYLRACVQQRVQGKVTLMLNGEPKTMNVDYFSLNRSMWDELIKQYTTEIERTGFYCFDVEVAEHKGGCITNDHTDMVKNEMIKLFDLKGGDRWTHHFDLHTGNIMKHKNKWVIIDTGGHFLKGVMQYLSYSHTYEEKQVVFKHIKNIKMIVDKAHCKSEKLDIFDGQYDRWERDYDTTDKQESLQDVCVTVGQGQA